MFGDKKLGWFCIVVMGVPGRGGVWGREWVVLLGLGLLLLVLPGTGTITGCAIW